MPSACVRRWEAHVRLSRLPPFLVRPVTLLAMQQYVSSAHVAPCIAISPSNGLLAADLPPIKLCHAVAHFLQVRLLMSRNPDAKHVVVQTRDLSAALVALMNLIFAYGGTLMFWDGYPAISEAVCLHSARLTAMLMPDHGPNAPASAW